MARKTATKKATKPAGAEVVKFPKTRGKKVLKSAPGHDRLPAGDKPRRGKLAPFAAVGKSLFPIMVFDRGIDGKAPVDATVFDGLRGVVRVRWPRADGQPSFVPVIRTIIRRDPLPVMQDMEPAVAASLAAGIVVAMAELEIQAPGNIAVCGKENEWQQVAALMRRLKMIDADMPGDLVDVP